MVLESKQLLSFQEKEPMWILIISLIALALVAATAGIIRNRKLQKKIDRGELDAMPEVQEVEPAEQAEEGKAAEEFLKANFEDSVPQLEDLSEKGYARANAMLFWAYYFGYEDYPGDPQKALKYAKKGSDAADPICGLLYAAYSDISQAEKLEQFRKLDRRCARWQMQRTICNPAFVHVIP